MKKVRHSQPSDGSTLLKRACTATDSSVDVMILDN